MRKFKKNLIWIQVFFVFLLSSCASMDPRNVDVTLETRPPVQKSTTFDQALSDLGQMTLVYGCDVVKIMCYGGLDKTGTSMSTGGEIPRDVLQVIESTVNSVGGNVYLISSDFDLMRNAITIGITGYENKRNPDVVLKAGITEFDRALETRGANEDLTVETAEMSGLPRWVPAKTIAFDYGHMAKTSIANITMDFNLFEFETNTGLSKMQSKPSIVVSKGLAESEFAINILGPTFGLKGTIKKVQGRHAAVRLLIQFAVIQVVGRYFDLPYWNLLTGVEPDSVVLATIENDFHAMDELARIIKIKELLFLHGYNIPINGEMDYETTLSLQHFHGKCDSDAYESVDAGMYISLYNSVPITGETLQRRFEFLALLNEFIESLIAPEEPAAQPHMPEQGAEGEPARPATENAANAETGPDVRAEKKNNKELIERLVDLLKFKRKTVVGNESHPEPSIEKNTGETSVSQSKEW